MPSATKRLLELVVEDKREAAEELIAEIQGVAYDDGHSDGYDEGYEDGEAAKDGA